MPTSKTTVKRALNEITESLKTLEEKLMLFNLLMNNQEAETVRDQKEIQVNNHLTHEFIEQVRHYRTVMNQDNSNECYCELELAQCTHNCKF